MLVKNKGISNVEKKKILRQIMSNSGEVYNLKELETIAQKHGIIRKEV